MALAYSNITVELKEILLNNRPQELYDISAKGTVPILCINNSTIIELPRWRVVDIDTEEDWKHAEIIYRIMKNK